MKIIITFILLLKILFVSNAILNGMSPIDTTKFRNVQIVTKNDVCRRCLDMPTSTTFTFSECNKDSKTKRFSFIRQQYKEDVMIKSVNYNVYWEYLNTKVFVLIQRNNEGDFMISSSRKFSCLTYISSSSMSYSSLFSTTCSINSEISNQYFQMVMGYDNMLYDISGSIKTSSGVLITSLSSLIFYLNGSTIANPSSYHSATISGSSYSVKLPKGSYKYAPTPSLYKKCEYKMPTQVITISSCEDTETTFDAIFPYHTDFTLNYTYSSADAATRQEPQFYYLKNVAYSGYYTSYIKLYSQKINHTTQKALIWMGDLYPGKYEIYQPVCNDKIDEFVLESCETETLTKTVASKSCSYSSYDPSVFTLASTNRSYITNSEEVLYEWESIPSLGAIDCQSSGKYINNF